MTPLLHASEITFAYGRSPVLRDVTLSLSQGEVLALLGPNGSGKSTLIQLLGGYLQGEGAISWGGRPMHSYSRRQLARLIAYLPQFPTYDQTQTVADLLALGRAPYLGILGLESAADAEVIGRTAELLDLHGLMGRSMNSLSGGQRQRAFIGRCLVQEPRALLLDEPSTSLDLRHLVELGQLLRRLSRENGIAVLMASHDMNLAGSFADRLILLHAGTVAAAGRPDDVLRPQLLSSIYGVPMDRIDRPGLPPMVYPVV